MDDRYIGLYDGFDKSFYKGFNAAPEKRVLDFIEESISHRDPRVVKMAAFQNQKDFEAYCQKDQIFKMSNEHPDNQELFKLKLTGGEPRINAIAH